MLKQEKFDIREQQICLCTIYFSTPRYGTLI